MFHFSETAFGFRGKEDWRIEFAESLVPIGEMLWFSGAGAVAKRCMVYRNRVENAVEGARCVKNIVSLPIWILLHWFREGLTAAWLSSV